MHVSFRNAVAVLALAGAAASSWYFSRPAPGAADTDDTAEGPPLGYYLRDATLLGTDEAGRFFYRIHAAEAVQERDEEALALTDVQVEYRDEQAADWSISAERAVTPDDRSYVDLEQVRLANDAGSDGQRIVIESPRLRLDPAEYLASTDARVRIRVGEATIAGVGLVARLREDFVKLESQVHGSSPR